MKEATIQLPRQMSTLAADIDSMYYFIFWVSVVFFVAIIGAAIWCMIEFRASKNPQATPPGHHDVLELFWTFAPLLLLIPMFHYGFKGYVKAMVAPDDAIEMRVRGKQWAWDFYYPGDVFGLETTMVPGDPGLGAHLLGGPDLAPGFDFSFSDEPWIDPVGRRLSKRGLTRTKRSGSTWRRRPQPSMTWPLRYVW